jgi:hypothetical protein
MRATLFLVQGQFHLPISRGRKEAQMFHGAAIAKTPDKATEHKKQSKARQ